MLRCSAGEDRKVEGKNLCLVGLLLDINLQIWKRKGKIMAMHKWFRHAHTQGAAEKPDF